MRFHVRVYDFAINWSHIHFVIKVNSRENDNAFIRALTSLITAKVQKTHPHLEKIFTLRPHTRILHWGRDFENALHDIQLNQMEA